MLVHLCGRLSRAFGLIEIETAVIRWDYGDPALGSCKETIEGGNHFRYWVQNGPSANRCASLFICPGYLLNVAFTSGAIFMALSYELPIARMFLLVTFCIHLSNLAYEEQHDIIPNGCVFPVFSLDFYTHVYHLRGIVIISHGMSRQNALRPTSF